MTGLRAPFETPERSAPDDLDLIRRRIRVRAAHRGLRELDIIFGRFAEAQADALDAEELRQFEALLDVDDDKAFGWLCAGAAPPPHDGSLFAKILAYCERKGAVF